MIIFSPAKINIGLQILRKRDDNFHDIASLMVQIPLFDILELVSDEDGSGFTFTQSGIIVPGELHSNLCYKAWLLFSEAHGETPVKVHLHKSIPMGAGLGGGSSNGTAILKGLNSLNKQYYSKEKLLHMAAQLGSDCSLFLGKEAVIARGRGEILEKTSINLSGYYLVLVNPGIRVNTASAYAKVKPNSTRSDIRDLLSKPLHQWKKLIVNDFEESVFGDFPKIAALKDELYLAGAIYASMSGSGSSVYGLFKNEPELSSELNEQSIFKGKL